MRAPAPNRRPATRARLAAALLAGFLILGAAVSAGGLDRLDQAAVDHAMPWLSSVQDGEPTLAERALPGYDASAHRGDEAAALAVYALTLPAAALPSALLAAAGLALLARRGQRRLALRLAIAFAVGVAVELVWKATLERPALELAVHGHLERLSGFDSSYPSGHALRALLLCVIAARLWPVARPATIVVACVVALLLELGGVHPPSDIAGGLLLGGALALWALRLGPSVDARRARCDSRRQGRRPGRGS